MSEAKKSALKNKIEDLMAEGWPEWQARKAAPIMLGFYKGQPAPAEQPE